MSSIDFKKEFSALYSAQEGVIERVETVYTGYLMVDGRGDANNNKAFNQAIDALFAVAHAAKFAIKNGQLGVDFSIMPLEALWWVDHSDAKRRKQSKYCWRLMVMQPEYVSEMLVEQCIEQVKKKKKLPILDRMRFDYMEEICAIQTLGKGVFDTRSHTAQNLRHYIEYCQMETVGCRHEVYLSDVRRGGVDRWKTIIRQGVAAFTDIEPPPPLVIEPPEAPPSHNSSVKDPAGNNTESPEVLVETEENAVVVDVAANQEPVVKRPRQKKTTKPRTVRKKPAETPSQEAHTITDPATDAHTVSDNAEVIPLIVSIPGDANVPASLPIEKPE